MIIFTQASRPGWVEFDCYLGPNVVPLNNAEFFLAIRKLQIPLAQVRYRGQVATYTTPEWAVNIANTYYMCNGYADLTLDQYMQRLIPYK